MSSLLLERLYAPAVLVPAWTLSEESGFRSSIQEGDEHYQELRAAKNKAWKASSRVSAAEKSLAHNPGKSVV